MTMKRHKRTRGFSLIELMIVIAIILIIAAIAVPKLNATRMQGQEMAAIQQVRTLHTAQTQYYSQFGRFAATLAELGPPTSGGPGPNGADLIPSNLAAGQNSGYQFQVITTPTGYSINANPVAYNNTGRRTFFSDQTFAVKENWGSEPATIASKEIK